MIQFKTKLTEEDKKEIQEILTNTVDVYGDFYITQNNLRLFIRDNANLLFENITKGDKVLYTPKGIAVVTGFSDGHDRKYIKILTTTKTEADKLIKNVLLNLPNCNLYIKIKKNNPIKDVLLKNYFQFKGGRGRELLLAKDKQEKKDVN